MRRSAVVCGILALFLASLVVTAVAEARAGGGFSSGSRGSRSYSAPRTPSAPASPTSPSLSPTQPRRPGFGWGGMIGGFLLGGLLGGLLFGHGFGGIGLLDILLVAGLAFLAFSLFRRRQPAPAYAGAAASTGWSSARASAAPVVEAPAGVATADRDYEDLERGIAAIRMMDPAFTPVRFAEVARDVFTRVQSAWSARDLSPVRAELADELAGSLEADLARLKTLRRVNRLDKVTVEGSAVTEAWQEYGKDFVTVRFRASVLDYTIDETTGTVVEGSTTVPSAFDEFWTFTRPVGPTPWRLSAIQQPAA